MRRTGSMRVVAACLLCLLASTSTTAAYAANDTRAERQFKEGLQLAADGRTEAALKIFKALTRDYPALPEPHVQLAAMYGRTGDLQLAIAALREALRLQSNNAALQEQLGDLYLQLAERAYAAAATGDSARPSAERKQAAVKPLTQSLTVH